MLLQLEAVASSSHSSTFQTCSTCRVGKLAVQCLVQRKRVINIELYPTSASSSAHSLDRCFLCKDGYSETSRKCIAGSRVHHEHPKINRSCNKADYFARLSSSRTKFTYDAGSAIRRGIIDSVDCCKRQLDRYVGSKFDLEEHILKDSRAKDNTYYVEKEDILSLVNRTCHQKECRYTVVDDPLYNGASLCHKGVSPPLQASAQRLFESTAEIDSSFDYKVAEIKRTLLREVNRKQVVVPMLLNLIAALYGSGIAAIEIADDALPAMPPSFISLLRSILALLVHFPALIGALRNLDPTVIRAGVELGSWSFLYSIIQTFRMNGTDLNDAPLLYALSVVLVPIMKLCAGGSITRAKWLSTFIALSGMGVLEEESLGWKGIIFPQGGNPWVFASSLISALQIFRAEVLGIGKALDAKRLNAVQSAVLSVLSFFWEICNLCSSSSDWCLDITTLAQHLPWLPLIYNGLVCGGLCSWLEIRALRGVNASVTTLNYMTIPIWGAFFSTLLRRKCASDLELLGGSMILLTTMWTNKMTNQQLTGSSHDQLYKTDLGLQRRDKDTGHANCRQNGQRDHSYLMKNVLISTLLSADHLPGVMLISQLKSPFYTAQTERLVRDIDFLFQKNTDRLSDFTYLFKAPQYTSDHNPALDVESPSFLGIEENVCDIGA